MRNHNLHNKQLYGRVYDEGNMNIMHIRIPSTVREFHRPYVGFLLFLQISYVHIAGNLPSLLLASFIFVFFFFAVPSYALSIHNNCSYHNNKMFTVLGLWVVRGECNPYAYMPAP